MIEAPAKTLDAATSRLSFRDLMVDFFGSLVPGLVFTAGTVVALIWPVLSAAMMVPRPDLDFQEVARPNVVVLEPRNELIAGRDRVVSSGGTGLQGWGH